MVAFSPRRWSSLLLLFLPTPTVTQLTFGDAPVTSIPPPTTKLLSSQSSTSSTTPSQPPSPTNSSSTTTTTTSNPDDSDDLPPTSVVNYYFLLLAILVLILLALAWTFHRRRKRNLALSRNGGHHALARDLEGWRGNRRWAAYGGGRGWRDVFSGHGSRTGGRGEECLDGRGEAPPPYDPHRLEEPRPVRALSLGYGRDRAVRTSIPLHTLDESAEEGKPPECSMGGLGESADACRVPSAV